MRWIEKGEKPAAPLADYLAAQSRIDPVVNVDYETFTRKTELRMVLVSEQAGLCAFTGIAIDERFGTTDVAKPINLKVHNAHLKPQSHCRDELVKAGKEPGRDVGEDMDHRNIVAAVLVDGAESEQFGAAAQKDWWHPELFVPPTIRGIDSRFRYAIDGAVRGIDCPAAWTSHKFRLNHPTLRRWRSLAVTAFINPANETDFSERHLREVIEAMTVPREGRLPEYCFVIRQVAERLLQRAQRP